MMAASALVRLGRFHNRVVPCTASAFPRLLTGSITRGMSTAEYLCVHVFIKIKPGTEAAFREASLKNARESSKEEGIARFDVLQDKEDPCSFVLVEVYKNDQAPAKHKETPHYAEWRDTVEDMMAEPRQARRFFNHFPTTASGWEYPAGAPLE